MESLRLDDSLLCLGVRAAQIKRFTPGLSVVKIQGSVAERDRILGMAAVQAAEFDIYLTTCRIF